MSIAVMNRIAELEKRVEVLEAAQRRENELGDERDWQPQPRKPGRPKKHDEASQVREG